MKNISLISFSLLLFLAGCFSSGSKDNSSAHSLKIVVVNVMDAMYFQDCHIKGSIHIPFDKFEARIASMNKNDEYVLYCSNYACTTSDFCAKMMKIAGFKHVWEYAGGMVDWFQKGYPVEGPCKLEYLKEENEKFDDDHEGDIPVITAEELKLKMEQTA